nr:L-asparagine transporter-like permease [Mucilaginibacter sp. SP1R1]
MIVTGAVILAAIITILALPSVSHFLKLSLSFNIISNTIIIVFLLAVTIIVTALAGFYPAIVLSRFNPGGGCLPQVGLLQQLLHLQP